MRILRLFLSPYFFFTTLLKLLNIAQLCKIIDWSTAVNEWGNLENNSVQPSPPGGHSPKDLWDTSCTGK